MDNFNLKKYLAEGKLKKEEVDKFEGYESEFERNTPGRINQFVSKLDDLLDEYHAELYLKDDVFTGLEAVKRAALGPDTAEEIEN